jgi:DNA recombination-dependent growth factor C
VPAYEVLIMGLLKGGFSFARFHVEGDLPQDSLNFINKQIKINSFREEQKLSQEKRIGWVSLTDVLDSDFAESSHVLGDYLVFCLRIDRKLISPKLLKLNLLKEEKQYLSQSGKNRISKHIATEMKDKITLNLLTRQDAVPSFYDICWSLRQNTVYFSSLADKVADDFVDLFKKTFSLNLRRLLPQENIPPANKNEAAEDVSLIGREFLTWLWFKSEERNGSITLNKDKEVELHFLKRIVLEAGEGEYSQGVVCSGLHAELKEGKEAIRQGKKVKEAGIRLTHDQNEWEFIFKADTFDFQSLKLPVIDMPEDSQDSSGKMLERIYLIENVAKTMDNLFESFLRIRFLPAWEENELKLLAKWLEH